MLLEQEPVNKARLDHCQENSPTFLTTPKPHLETFASHGRDAGDVCCVSL